MTAKEFVKTHYPNALARKYEQGSGVVKALRETYFLCTNGYHGDRLGIGNTVAKCWGNAKGNIIAKQQKNDTQTAQ